jgi:hypothetical protein
MSVSNWKQRLRLVWSVLTGQTTVQDHMVAEEEATIYKAQYLGAMENIEDLREENRELRRDTILAKSKNKQLDQEYSLQVQINLHMKDALEETRRELLAASKDYDSLEGHTDELEDLILDTASELREVWENGTFPFPNDRTGEDILDWMETPAYATTSFAQIWAMERDIHAVKEEDHED